MYSHGSASHIQYEFSTTAAFKIIYNRQSSQDLYFRPRFVAMISHRFASVPYGFETHEDYQRVKHIFEEFLGLENIPGAFEFIEKCGVTSLEIFSDFCRDEDAFFALFLALRPPTSKSPLRNKRPFGWMLKFRRVSQFLDYVDKLNDSYAKTHHNIHTKPRYDVRTFEYHRFNDITFPYCYDLSSVPPKSSRVFVEPPEVEIEDKNSSAIFTSITSQLVTSLPSPQPIQPVEPLLQPIEKETAAPLDDQSFADKETDPSAAPDAKFVAAAPALFELKERTNPRPDLPPKGPIVVKEAIGCS